MIFWNVVADVLVVYDALSQLPLVFLAGDIGSQSYKSEAATSTTLSVTSTCSIGKFSMVTTSQIWSGRPWENLLVFMELIWTGPVPFQMFG